MERIERLTASEMVMSRKEWAGLCDGETPLTNVTADWNGQSGAVVAVVWGDDDAQEKRLACLFAAAPQMLRALKKARDTIAMIDGDSGNASELLAAVDAAIASAEGRGESRG